MFPKNHFGYHFTSRHFFWRAAVLRAVRSIFQAAIFSPLNFVQARGSAESDR